MEVPACTTVGLAVGVAADAQESGRTWLDDCRFAVGIAPWLVEEGGVFADLGEATGAWLAVCGIDVGTAL
jgi:hypothetical protein